MESNISHQSILYNDIVTIDGKIMPLYLGNSFDMFTIQNSNLELDALSSMNGFGTSIIVSSLIASFLIGTYYKYPLYQYMYDNADEINNKPVDLLILFHAIIEHLTCLLMVTFISIGMIFKFTFASYFGETWCLLPWYAAMFGGTYRVIGTLGIAILRLIYILAQSLI